MKNHDSRIGAAHPAGVAMGKKHWNEAWNGGAEIRPGVPRLRGLTESLPVAAMIADPVGAPLVVNDRFRNLLGEPPAEGWLLLVEPDERAAAESAWLLAGIARTPHEVELGFQCPEGPFRATCRIAPVEEEGRVLGWAITLAGPDLRADLSAAEARPRALEEELGAARARTQGLEEQIAAGESRRHELEEQLKAAELHRRRTDSLLAASEARWEEAEERLEAGEVQRCEVERRLSASEAHRLEAEERLAPTEARRLELEALLAAAEARAAEVESRLALAEGRRREADWRRAEAESQLAQTGERLREAEERLAAEGQAMAELRAALNDAVAERDEARPLAEGRTHALAEARLAEAEARAAEAPASRARQTGFDEASLAEKSATEPASWTDSAEPAADAAEPRSIEAAESDELRGMIAAVAGPAGEPDMAQDHPVALEPEAEGSGETGGEPTEWPESALRDEPAPTSGDAPRQPDARTRDPDGSDGGPEDATLHTDGIDAGEGREPLPEVGPEAAGSGEAREDLADAPLGAAEEEGVSLQDGSGIDQLAARLRSGTLRDALGRWRASLGPGGVPPFARWDETATLAGQVVIEMDDSGVPVRLRIVRSLEETPLLRALAAPPGGEGHGWRRCAVTGRPAHDYVQVGLGPQGSHSLERLLLPFSTDGGYVDRLVLLMVTEEGGRAEDMGVLAF